MGVKMDVSRVKIQLIQMNRHLSDVQTQMNNLKTQFQGFGDDTELISEAYNSHKDYIQNMQVPTANGVKTFCETMIEANNQYMDAIDQYFSYDILVEEDKWRMEYDSLIAEYNRQNSYLNWFIETTRNMIPGGRRPPVMLNGKMIYTLKEELEHLKATIEWYRKALENIGKLLTTTVGIYSNAEAMQSVVAQAIAQLGVVSINANGVYATAVVDRFAFQNIKRQQLIIEVSKELKLELGEDFLTQKEFESLDTEAKVQYLNKLATLVAKYYPMISAEVGEGTVEIPIAPGLVIYAGVAVSADIIRTDSSVEVSLAAAKNGEILSTWEASIGSVNGEFNISEGVVGHTYKIDDKTSAYVEIKVDVSETMVVAEWGVETTVDRGKVTTKCGVKAKPQDANWTEVNLADYKLPSPADIKFEGEGILGPAWVLPIPVPVPVF